MGVKVLCRRNNHEKYFEVKCQTYNTKSITNKLGIIIELMSNTDIEQLQIKIVRCE